MPVFRSFDPLAESRNPSVDPDTGTIGSPRAALARPLVTATPHRRILRFVRRDLPSGTVTFVFTDIEASTKLLRALGAEAYAEALAEHRRILRGAFTAESGIEVDTQGDALFFAFPTAPGALRAAAEARRRLSTGPIRVRMGIHTGTPHLSEEGYVGLDVHRAARIAACGHGGQVLISASTASLAGTAGLRDLGEHRLKDLSAPERIYQLGNDDFSPLKSLHRTNLPIPSTPFFGRERELSEVVGLISRADVRLLTLTGPGGTGKTRLAMQAAAGLTPRYPDGVWWVPLGSVRDPRLVLETAARSLGAKAGLAEHIAKRSMLLLLDNFEQLIEAAAQIAALLSSCANLDVLATSRERLHLSGEHEYFVPPLAQDEGVDFFLARARAVRPDFLDDAAVPKICRRLEDLPLALELAAARVKALSSGQLLERLERRLSLLTGGAKDLPERQRTLRAAIEWSYELLSAIEQRLFVRLGVFNGGFTLDAAEDVADADLETLESLVDKSLLRFNDERFWLLETIREYAAERLPHEDHADGLRQRHALYFLALAETAEPMLRGSPKDWLDRLETEQDNFRAAFEWLEAAGETERVLRLAGALWRFWSTRGYFAEGRRRLDSALGSDNRPTQARANALTGAAWMAEGIAAARALAEEALALHQTLGDAWGTAFCRYMLGSALGEEGDFMRAQRVFDESVRRFRELGDEHTALAASRALAWTYEELGDLERSRLLHEDNLRRARVLGNKRIEARSLGSLGAIAGDREGRVADALSLLKEAYRIDRDHGDRLEMALDLCRMAAAVAAGPRSETAASLLSRAEELRDEIGATYPAWGIAMNQRTLAAIRAKLDDAAFGEAWRRGRTLTVDDAVTLALDALN